MRYWNDDIDHLQNKLVKKQSDSERMNDKTSSEKMYVTRWSILKVKPKNAFRKYDCDSGWGRGWGVGCNQNSLKLHKIE